jgi:transposase
MGHATLLGDDLGKHSFHIHEQGSKGKVVFRRKLGRKQSVEFFATYARCTVMEACVGSHSMARRLAAFGQDVRLISP